MVDGMTNNIIRQLISRCDLTGDARPRFFDALLEKQVRRARSDDGRL